MGILQIPGAIVGRGFPSFRRFVRPGGLSWRVLYLGLIALPLLPLSGGVKLAIILALVAVATGANAFVGSMYNEWIAELVPADSRGFFFGKRQAIATGVGAVVGLLGGFLLDAFRARGSEPMGFAVVFGIGVACGGLSLMSFDRIRDVPREPVRQSLVAGLRAIGDPFGDRAFRHVLLYIAVTVAGQNLAGNLFTVYALEMLKLPYSVVLGLGLMYSVGIVLATRFWGSMSDRYGNKPMLAIANTLQATNVLWWCLTVPGAVTGNTLLLLSTHVLMGTIFCGQALCQFNLILSTAKPEDRANYMAAGTTVMAVAAGVAPLLGALLIPAMPSAWNYKFLFLMAGLLRLLAVPLLTLVHEHGSAPIRDTLLDLRRLTPRSVGAMRRLSRSDDAAIRAEAIQTAAEEGAEMAADDILAALHDPQPKVRRQAASALATLRDPRAAAVILREIEASPDLLEEETLDALGKLGDPSAIPTLVATLENPRPLLRRAAARALGRVGGPEAVEPLERAARSIDPDLRRAALQGLRQCEARQAEPTIAAALAEPHPSVRVAAAEAIAELELKGAAPALRASLEAFDDEASAEVAYALGVVGTPEDLPLILRHAKEAKTTTNRRRALLGAARLLGAERDAYRLMLLSGMARDTAIVERMRPLRREAAARLATVRYGQGDEAGALQALARVRPELMPLAEMPVEEAFLVGVAAT